MWSVAYAYHHCGCVLDSRGDDSAMLPKSPVLSSVAADMKSLPDPM